MPLLDVRRVNVRIPTEDGTLHAVRDASFTVEEGDFFGVAGESGSGKSVLVQAMLGLIPQAEVTGEVLFRGEDLLQMRAADLRRLRGSRASMIFQDPLSSLHPQFTIGWQISEQIRTHERVTRHAARARAVHLLDKVGIHDARARFDHYPHQFSGGMRQRVMIAMALSLNPSLIIADEPTTALDSTVQLQILDLLNALREEFRATVLMITHDLGILAQYADRMMVMYAGRVVESGRSAELFAHPIHPYSAGLLRSSPAGARPGTMLHPIPGRPPSLLRADVGCMFSDRCPSALPVCHTESPPLRMYSNGSASRCWLEQPAGQVSEPASEGLALVAEQQPAPAVPRALQEPIIQARAVALTIPGRRRAAPARILDGIDLTVHRGETLGLVGESGCGKSTLARAMAGLTPITSGSVSLRGKDLALASRRQWRELRAEVQLVFQDPYGALNPRRRVGAIIGDPLRIHGVSEGAARKRRIQELMELVGLEPAHYNRYPAQFSGGQRQRIGIARALALNPSLIICDEPVSALDVSVQAQVLNLLSSLQQELGLAYLFISHDLGVVRHMCSRIAVMEHGRIVELADAEQLYEQPQAEITRKLLRAASSIPPLRGTDAPRLVSTAGEGSSTC